MAMRLSALSTRAAVNELHPVEPESFFPSILSFGVRDGREAMSRPRSRIQLVAFAAAPFGSSAEEPGHPRRITPTSAKSTYLKSAIANDSQTHRSRKPLTILPAILAGRGEARLLADGERALADGHHLPADVRGDAEHGDGGCCTALRAVQGFEDGVGQQTVPSVAFVGGLARLGREASRQSRPVKQHSLHVRSPGILEATQSVSTILHQDRLAGKRLGGRVGGLAAGPRRDVYRYGTNAWFCVIPAHACTGEGRCRRANRWPAAAVARNGRALLTPWPRTSMAS